MYRRLKNNCPAGISRCFCFSALSFFDFAFLISVLVTDEYKDMLNDARKYNEELAKGDVSYNLDDNQKKRYEEIGVALDQAKADIERLIAEKAEKHSKRSAFLLIFNCCFS